MCACVHVCICVCVCVSVCLFVLLRVDVARKSRVDQADNVRVHFLAKKQQLFK